MHTKAFGADQVKSIVAAVGNGVRNVYQEVLFLDMCGRR